MTLSIHDPLPLLHLKEWRLWRLLENFEWNGIFVQEGFEFDGASIPRPFWWLLPTTGPYMSAAMIHDLLIRMWLAGTPHKKAPTRGTCDMLFLEAMEEAGVGYITRTIVFMGVSIGGDKKIEKRVREADQRRERLHRGEPWAFDETQVQ